MTADGLVQLLVTGLGMGGIYALMALGFHLIYVASRTLNFAYGSTVVLGGLVALALLVGLKLPLGAVFVLVMVLGWLFGLAFNRLVVLPLRDANAGAIIIGLFAAGIVIENGYAVAGGKLAMPFPSFSGETPLMFFGTAINSQNLWIIGISLAIAFGVKGMLSLTSIGRAMRASANNPFAARLVGISQPSIYAYAFGMATCIAFVAGTIVAPITFAGGFMAMPFNMKGFTGAILGGLTSPMGAVAGGFLFGVLESLVAGLVTSTYSDVLMMGILVGMLLLRPEGLFGTQE